MLRNQIFHFKIKAIRTEEIKQIFLVDLLLDGMVLASVGCYGSVLNMLKGRRYFEDHRILVLIFVQAFI
jgi:hypothetical protein